MVDDPRRYLLDDGWIDLDLVTLDLRDDDPGYLCVPKNIKSGHSGDGVRPGRRVN
jgi:hypothetical protein